jgi:hypothetical protein
MVLIARDTLSSSILFQQRAHQNCHPDGGRAPKNGNDLHQSTGEKSQFDNDK